jgi:hypothetical protein
VGLECLSVVVSFLLFLFFSFLVVSGVCLDGLLGCPVYGPGRSVFLFSTWIESLLLGAISTSSSFLVG